MSQPGLERAAAKALRDYLRLKKQERALLLHDVNTAAVAEAFAAAAAAESLDLTSRQIALSGGHGFEPDPETAALMTTFNVVVCPTTYSLTHTAAARAAKRAGARVATLPGITAEIFERCLAVEPQLLAQTGNQWIEELLNGSKMRVRSAAGSDFTLSYGKYPVVNDNGCYWTPCIGNLPAGEVFFAPDPGSTVGVIVIDGSVGGLEWAPGQPPGKLTLEGGSIVGFEGEKAEALKRLLAPRGPNALKHAEVGIGTNPDAIIGGNMLEDEKVKGTIHVAFGNNVGFGGDNNVEIHIDCLVRAPTIHIDGYQVMDNGQWLF